MLLLSELNKRKKMVLYSLVVLSVVMAVLVNFPLIWEMLGLFALIVFVYKISIYSHHSNEEDRKKNFPLTLKKLESQEF